MLQRTGLCFAALLVALVAVSPAWAADIVTRKSVKAPATGDVTDNSKTEVTVKPRTGEVVKVPVNDIVSISWNAEPAAAAIARSAEKSGQLQSAIDSYGKILGTTPNASEGLKTDLNYAIARATAKLAIADASKVDEAITKLEAFKSKNGDNYNYYDCVRRLGELYTIKKDNVKARVSLEALGKAPWKEYQMASKIMLATLSQIDGKLDDAEKAYGEVVDMKADNPSEESQRQAAMLGKSRILVGQKKYDEALKMLDEVIEKSEPEDARVQAEAYVRQGDCLAAQGKDKEAVLAYLHVDVLFPTEKSMHAESLYQLTRLWKKVGNQGRSDETKEKLESDYPNSDWTKQLKSAPAEGG